MIPLFDFQGVASRFQRVGQLIQLLNLVRHLLQLQQMIPLFDFQGVASRFQRVGQFIQLLKLERQLLDFQVLVSFMK
ncbi:hypothetical protein [Pseudomonas sp. S30_BP2TU TE3576]|uniref:hypothetical protein n=1 Tax=Pseudomonas sp. S30_BP2TU TE3576 TaxID=3349329 RepID=UPI003D1ADBA0